MKQPFYVCITGGRDYNDYNTVCRALAHVRRHSVPNGHWTRMVLVVGGAKGADTLAEQWARRNGIAYLRVPAEWDELGKAAGHLRNEEMLSWVPIKLLIAFPGGRGTAHAVKTAQSMGIQVYRPDRDAEVPDDEFEVARLRLEQAGVL